MPCDTSKGMERENICIKNSFFGEKRKCEKQNKLRRGFMLYLFDVNWYFGYNDIISRHREFPKVKTSQT